MSEVIQSFFKSSFLLFIVLGVILLIVGSASGITIDTFNLEITNPLLQQVIFIIGVFLIIVGVVSEIRHSKSPENTDSTINPNTKTEIDDAPEMKLTGTWYVYFGFKTKRLSDETVGTAKIKMLKDNKFAMTIDLTKSKSGSTIFNSFEYEGFIINRQILCTFKSRESKGEFMVGTMIMRPNPQGDIIFCGSTYLNCFNKIVMDSCLLTRERI